MERLELVTHDKLGLGKVVAVEGDNVHVFFVDQPGQAAVCLKNAAGSSWLTMASSQSHPMLDNLPPFRKAGTAYQLPSNRVTLAEAVDRFHREFPMGFKDPRYLGDEKKGERNYKLSAHHVFLRELGDGQARRLLRDGAVDELRQRLLRVDSASNLLYPQFEKAPLRDGLADDAAALHYFEALFDYVEADEPTADLFSAMVSALSRLPQPGSNPDSWPVATVFPFLANPSRDIFLRPTQAKKAAALMAFELNYEATPNWLTYSRWLRLANLMLEQLEGARDLIDVQSFLFVLCADPKQL